MSGQSRYSKTDFINFVLADLDSISSSAVDAKEYLASEGLDVNELLEKGRKRIARFRLKIDANQTRSEMLSMDALKVKAMEWVEKIMGSREFSFAEFIRTENLALQNRNIEGFT